MTVHAAPEGSITDEAVEQLRRRIGLLVPGIAEGNTMASRDAFVNYCRGMGETDPLYRDERYAETSRWKGLVGHPTFLRYMGDGITPPEHRFHPDELAPKGDPLAGVHGFFGGVEIELFRHLRPGDRLAVRGGLGRVEAKDSRMGGRSVHETYDKVCRNQDGQLVGVARDLHVRIERGAARDKREHLDKDVPKHYSPEEIEEIDRYYEGEEIRGKEPRWWEDVEVGETSTPMVKGPYTVTSFIVFMSGVGLLRNRFSYVHAEAYQRRRRHPRAFPVNPLGIPDSVANVHWEQEMAQRAGVPERYDAGAERIAWTSQAVTHWMGDDAFLRRIAVSIRGFLYVGDTLWLTCEVVDKFERIDGRGVTLRINGRTQRDEIVVRGEADVLLPSRVGGPVSVPVIPDAPVSPFDQGWRGG